MSSTLQAKCLTLPELEACLCSISNNPPEIHRTRNQCLILLMADAGLRVGEVSKLELRDIWLGPDIVQSLRIRKEIAKNGTERTVPVSKSLRLILRHYSDTSPLPFGEDILWLFPSPRNPSEHLSVRQIQLMVRSTGKLALGREINPHMLRHTFATRLASIAPIHVVQELLGHKHISSTQVYTHASAEACRDAIGRL